jgi:hypothetical protein
MNGSSTIIRIMKASFPPFNNALATQAAQTPIDLGVWDDVGFAHVKHPSGTK